MSLEEARGRHDLPTTDEEFGFLSDLLQRPALHALVHVHNKVAASRSARDDSARLPVLSSAMQVALEVLADVVPRMPHPEAKVTSTAGRELYMLLQTPHIQVNIQVSLLQSWVYLSIQVWANQESWYTIYTNDWKYFKHDGSLLECDVRCQD